MKGFYRLFVVITALSCCLNLASAQDETEWMPDENLRTAVRQTLNIDANNSLTQQAMQGLTILNAENSGITDIKGLEHATQLEVLNLGVNEITTLTLLEGLTRLTELSLNANRIRDITPLETLVNLTRLNLGANQLADIVPLTELIQITDLNLLNNNISDITALTKLTRITKIRFIWESNSRLKIPHVTHTNIFSKSLREPDY